MSFDAAPSDNLYMKGLPPGTTEETLRAIFGVYGTVVSCKVLASPAGVSDAAALVRMSNVSEAQYLVDNAVNIAAGLGTPVQIKFANSGAKGGGKGMQQSLGGQMMGGACGGGFPGGGCGGGGFAGEKSSRLYMKGLPLGMSDEQLRSIIGAYGNVLSLKVLQPPPGGANDSAAIVQMGTEPEATWLVENLDGNIPQGLSSPVQIKYKSDGPPGGGGGGCGAPPMMTQSAPPSAAAAAQMNGDLRGAAPSDNLYIRGLPPGCMEETIQAIFGVYGTVTSVKVLPPPPGKNDVACLMRMNSIDEAKWLVENLNGNIPQGLTEPINVRFADNVKGPGKGGGGPPPSMGMGGGGGHVPAPTWGAPPGGPQADIPSCNLYMKGLPNDITEMSLRSIFGAYGNVVSVKILATPPGVTNSAAALVQMGALSEAEWLVTNVNNNIPEGLSSPIMIKFANNPKGTGKGGFGGGGGYGGGCGGSTWGPAPVAPAPAPMMPMHGGGGQSQPSDNLYMKGFPADVDENGLRAILGPYGNIVSVKVLPSPPGKNCGAALVRMSTVDEAKWLVDNMNGNIPEGQSQPVEVKYAANSGGSGKGGGKGEPVRWGPY